MSPIPDQIGRYRVERLIGQGAMGSVYLGRDPKLDRAVAIKAVRELDLDDARLGPFLERFRNEARAAARLSHPAIVAVYDVGEDEAVGPFLVFEYVAGSSLKQILQARGPLSAADTVRLGQQLAGALDTAHRAGVIHRDIKPDNILIGADGRAKLADFGVARMPDAALTKEGQFLGTPCYAAPETLARGDYGPETDLFSFAAVLYEAASGARAFPGQDAIAVAHRVVNEDPPPPSEAAEAVRIPRAVDDVLMRGLAKDPAERYRTASALVEALQLAYVAAGVLEPDPTGSHPLPLGGMPPVRARLGGWGFALVVMGGLVVGMALVAAFADLGGGPVDPEPVLAPDEGPVVAAEDAGPAADAGVIVLTEPDARRVPAETRADAATPAAGPADAGAAPDLGRDAGVAGLSSFERDEAAKDAVAEARRLLGAGDPAGAAAALRRARAFDPGNSDIRALEAELLRRRASGPSAGGQEPTTAPSGASGARPVSPTP
ncbi:MAG: serine/threonine-protein kinase [Sandaracinaceae bacterium]